MSEPMKEIERLAKALADRRDTLKERLQALRDELAAVRKEHMRGIGSSLGKLTDAYDELLHAVDSNRALFAKPKTRTFHAIRVGWAKQRGRVVIADAERTVELIDEHLPDQVEQLVKETRKPVAAALQQLTDPQLESIGVTITEGKETPFVTAVDDEIDKLVSALLHTEDGTATAEAALK